MTKKKEETPDERATRLANQRAARAKKRANETEAQRTDRLKKEKAARAARKEKETPDQKATRQQKSRRAYQNSPKGKEAAKRKQDRQVKKEEKIQEKADKRAKREAAARDTQEKISQLRIQYQKNVADLKPDSTITIVPRKYRGSSPAKQLARKQFLAKKPMAAIRVLVPKSRLEIASAKIQKMRNSLADSPKPKTVGNYYSWWVKKQLKARKLKGANPKQIQEAMSQIAKEWNQLKKDDTAIEAIKAQYESRKLDRPAQPRTSARLAAKK